MKCLKPARLAVWLLFAAAVYFLMWAEAELNDRLVHTAMFTGWVLLLLVVFAVAFSVRKKMPAARLGSSALWLELHIAAALLSFAAFVLHTGCRIPQGTFEILLALCYWTVFLSGVFGFLLTRVVPRWLTSRGCEVLFERIPAFMEAIRRDVDDLAIESIAGLNSTSVADYYLSRLRPFFVRPRNLVWHVLDSDRATRSLLQDVQHQRSFMNEDEQAVLDHISDRLRKKNDLDFQYAMQGLLKVWSFAHIPLAYGLLVLSAFHLVVVYTFIGGIW